MVSLEQYVSDHLIVIGAVGLGLCSLEVIFFYILFNAVAVVFAVVNVKKYKVNR